MNALQLFTVLINFFAFVVYVYLIWFVLNLNRKELLNRLCALAIMPFAIWSFAFTFLHSASTVNAATFWMNVASIGWCSFPVGVLWFYLGFSHHEKLLKKKSFIAVCLFLAAFFIYEQWNGNLIVDLVRQPYGWSSVWKISPMSFAFSMYYLLFVVGCMYSALDFEHRTNSVREKKQARIFYVNALVSLILGTTTDVMLPMLGIGTVPPLADVFILSWAGGLVYAVKRYGFMALTPATAAEDILSTVADSLMLVGVDGKIVLANKRVYELLGYTEQELKGKDIGSIADGIDMAALLESGTIRSQELTLVKKNGEQVPVLFSASAVKDQEGEIVGIVVTALDITEYKKVEQELRASEQKYRTLIDHALVGIGIHQDNRIVFANRRMATMLGYSPEEFIGLPIADLIHPAERSAILSRAHKRQSGSLEPETYEIRLLRKDGSFFYALISNGLIDYNGRVATLITISDITDTKARRELEEANKELEAFSYSVSHDLRAPLRSIDGFSQVLLEDYADKLDDQGKDYLRRIRAASLRMSQLINDLLTLSRVTRAEIHFEEVDLTTIVENIAAELKERQPDRNVKFIIAQNVKAYGDSHLLRIVLENLLDNAWKFTSKHKDAVIEFGAKECEGKRVYFVRDDGAGFDMAYVNKLFVPFQRLHEQDEFEGTGIGLATVQRIVHRHGGKVWAEGEVEKGATFYFTLQL
ncbi:MAG TPA: PAS domain S-box protein [Clostridiales bacterium]|nr:PAS domain S-box protein [Clostridiales bacterium]HQE49820.1 PAS domain S-box protein [Fervidobacterium sp.]